MIYQISLPLPPTLNEIINESRGGWQAAASTKKQWTNKIAGFIEECGFTLQDKVWLEFNWYLKNFGRDADNVAAAAKYIMDGIVSGKGIRNDNLTIIQSPVIHYYHRSNIDIAALSLSNCADFLLDNFIDSNQFSVPALQQLNKKTNKLLNQQI